MPRLITTDAPCALEWESYQMTEYPSFRPMPYSRTPPKGAFALLLENVEILDKPIPLPGSLGFFGVDDALLKEAKFHPCLSGCLTKNH
jgi:hypothetical protein